MHGTFDTFRLAVVYLAFVQKAKDPIGTLQALRRRDSPSSLPHCTGIRDQDAYTSSQSRVYGWNWGYHDPAVQPNASDGNVGGRPSSLCPFVADEGCCVGQGLTGNIVSKRQITLGPRHPEWS
ncbi:hypothetical protein B0H14DRAFT_2577572 [Mycena olivaceomarginata]|nr:hypothetical protein B0H14DRAFT_2577572 [Mycena olivaceomarginata]